MIRTASAQWLGSGKEGNGTLSTQSKTLSHKPYSFTSRFEEGEGTNPEELIAAAHAGCFTMKISFLVGAKGIVPTSIDTLATLLFKDGGIHSIHLSVVALIEGIEKEAFEAIVEEARATCVISKVLNCEITAESKLN